MVSLEPPSPGFNQMARQRARIHRQLRLMFIYPIVYTLMWLLPFVYHCMMYNDYYATHPVWAMRMANTICIASMGFVDCLVFALRERPWRAIPNSDGTLLGSFFVWNGKNERRRRRRRRSTDRMRGGGRSRSAGPCAAVVPKEEVTQRSLSDGGLYGPRRSVGSSASFYGYSRAEKNWARERLEWEREERYRVLRERAMRSQTIISRRGSLSESSCGGREAEESRRDHDYDNYDQDDDDDDALEGERTETGAFEKSHSQGHDEQGNNEETQGKGGNSIS
ncbi:hypothetical protein yc1106_03220 [Curvularia clavata]|uniref:G protein-coupled receptor GPR1/2/3 C-terminal domain-containing protein n=1 Tax=Curvularia clavata TaxID=95742 RepID=A0A9Q8Z502_CURCL|nr:hypothetical protein yc1106_03220 [Curvularia clavata]